MFDAALDSQKQVIFDFPEVHNDPYEQDLKINTQKYESVQDQRGSVPQKREDDG